MAQTHRVWIFRSKSRAFTERRVLFSRAKTDTARRRKMEKNIHRDDASPSRDALIVSRAKSSRSRRSDRCDSRYMAHARSARNAELVANPEASGWNLFFFASELAYRTPLLGRGESNLR